MREKQKSGQFKCDGCGMIFGSESQLQEHQKHCDNVHEGSRSE
jgi:hypothetical protein